MKKLFILPAALLMAVVAVNAQEGPADLAKAKMEVKDAKAEKKEVKKALRASEEDEVGVLTRDHFYEDFGDVDPAWRRTKFFDEASFINEGKQTTAYYDQDAKLVGTTSPADFADLPAAAQKTINKEYKDYKIESVFLFNDNETNSSEMMLYGTTFSDRDNYFVEMTKGGKKRVVEVDMDGLVSFFSEQTR